MPAPQRLFRPAFSRASAESSPRPSPWSNDVQRRAPDDNFCILETRICRRQSLGQPRNSRKASSGTLSATAISIFIVTDGLVAQAQTRRSAAGACRTNAPATKPRQISVHADLDHFRRLSGGSAKVPTAEGGRGASQCTHRPLSQASAQAQATTATPHWPLSITAQNQNGWLTSATMQAQR